ncbi:MAG: H-type lectin domain-containing protein [Magnetococcales bacterium]|nr:H-type lectin domain-containing protein [Magnetococcales bacterium]
MAPVNKILLAILALLVLGVGGLLLMRQEPEKILALLPHWGGNTSQMALLEQKLGAVQTHNATLQHHLEQLQRQLPPQLTERLTAAEESLATLQKSSGHAVRLEGGSVQTSIQNMEWRLADLISGRREFRREVTFAAPFTTPPRVVLGITSLEVAEGQPRFGVTAQQVEVDKFVLVFETRAETRMREAQVDWLAFGQ